MNRSEFIKTIMELYPNVFHAENIAQYQGWINRYKSTIPSNWDFDKLLTFFDREWNSTVQPPHPSFFLKFREDVKPREIVEEIQLSEQEKRDAHESFLKFQSQLRKVAKEKQI